MAARSGIGFLGCGSIFDNIRLYCRGMLYFSVDLVI